MLWFLLQVWTPSLPCSAHLHVAALVGQALDQARHDGPLAVVQNVHLRVGVKVAGKGGETGGCSGPAAKLYSGSQRQEGQRRTVSLSPGQLTLRAAMAVGSTISGGSAGGRSGSRQLVADKNCHQVANREGRSMSQGAAAQQLLTCHERMLQAGRRAGARSTLPTRVGADEDVDVREALGGHHILHAPLGPLNLRRAWAAG
jgi:hypothetical protein